MIGPLQVEYILLIFAWCRSYIITNELLMSIRDHNIIIYSITNWSRPAAFSHTCSASSLMLLCILWEKTTLLVKFLIILAIATCRWAYQTRYPSTIYILGKYSYFINVLFNVVLLPWLLYACMHVYYYYTIPITFVYPK